LANGKNIADCQSGFLAAVDKGTSVEPFGCDEGFFPEFIAVWVTEDDSCQGSTTGRRCEDLTIGSVVIVIYSPARIVDDFFYDTPDVAIAFGKVKRTQAGGIFIKVSVRLELIFGNGSA